MPNSNQVSQKKTLSSISPARLWALKIVDAVFTEGKLLLDELPLLENAVLADNDFRLAREIISGTCRYWGKCRFVLNQFASNLDNLPTIVQRILELSTYQLFYLDRVPDYAVLNDAAELTRYHKYPKLTRVVNGILRNIKRKQHAINWPQRSEDFARTIAVEHSHPQWLVESWINRWGKEKTETLCQYNNSRAPLSLRLCGEPSEAKKELLRRNVAFHADDRFPNRVEIAGEFSPPPGFFQTPYWTAQDGAAMLVVDLLKPQPNWSVWDACAAPGAKTIYIEEQMNFQGKIIATDKNANRLQNLKKQINLSKHSIVETHVVDLLSNRKHLDLGTFDAILIDAPCTGWGTFRRHPDLRWRLNPQDPERLGDFALQLLNNSQKRLKLGGILVYSTCTLSLEENENVVTQFLLKHPNYEIEPAAQFLPHAFQAAQTGQGSYCLFPPDWNLDGSFGVRLRKRGGGA